LKANINNIVKIKKNFLKLLAQKVKEIHKILNNSKKDKLRLNMTTKGSSKKQVIILMSSQNVNKIIAKSNTHVTNINRLLKDVKSDVLADFMHVDSKGMVITTNKVAANSNLNIIKKYIKNVDNVNMNKVLSPRLSQLKYYLKILDISYYVEDTNLLIIADIVKRVI